MPKHSSAGKLTASSPYVHYVYILVAVAILVTVYTAMENSSLFGQPAGKFTTYICSDPDSSPQYYPSPNITIPDVTITALATAQNSSPADVHVKTTTLELANGTAVFNTSDFCDTNGTLHEGFCTLDQHAYLANISCPSGTVCVDGACKVLQLLCEDTDGGEDYSTWGYAYRGSEYNPDVCATTVDGVLAIGWLAEGVCRDNYPEYSLYKCANGCVNGTCREGLTINAANRTGNNTGNITDTGSERYCIDFDGGLMYYVASYAREIGKENGNFFLKEYEDKCKDGNTIEEQFCSGGRRNWVDYLCPLGCVNDPYYNATTGKYYAACKKGSQQIFGNLTVPPGFYITCFDSDYGINPFRSGHVTDSVGIIIKDSCTDENSLSEVYCRGNKYPSFRQIICSNGCTINATTNDGYCIQKTSVQSGNKSCSDLDGGNDFMLASSATNGVTTANDSCINETILREGSCNSSADVVSENIICPFGCSNNACKPQLNWSLNPNISTACSDSNGLVNISGLFSYLTEVDSCVSNTTVIDFFCANPTMFSYDVKNCTYGCANGTCISSSSIGNLSVSSTPTGANVTVDGILKGITPKTVTGLTAGFHSVKVSKTGYNDSTTIVNVLPGTTTNLAVVLNDTIKPAISMNATGLIGIYLKTGYYELPKTGNITITATGSDAGSGIYYTAVYVRNSTGNSIKSLTCNSKPNCIMTWDVTNIPINKSYTVITQAVDKKMNANTTTVYVVKTNQTCDECDPNFTPFCVKDGERNGTRECKLDASSGCYKLGPIIPCGLGQYCFAGFCEGAISNACVDECGPTGAKKCATDSSYRVCLPPNPCYKWSTIYDCEKDAQGVRLSCIGKGECTAKCKHECDPFISPYCDGSGGWRVCSDTDGDDCAEKGVFHSCGAGCLAGYCKSCVSNCEANGLECISGTNMWRKCELYDDGCWLWSAGKECARGYTCRLGVCA